MQYWIQIDNTAAPPLSEEELFSEYGRRLTGDAPCAKVGEGKRGKVVDFFPSWQKEVERASSNQTTSEPLKDQAPMEERGNHEMRPALIVSKKATGKSRLNSASSTSGRRVSVPASSMAIRENLKRNIKTGAFVFFIIFLVGCGQSKQSADSGPTDDEIKALFYKAIAEAFSSVKVQITNEDQTGSTVGSDAQTTGTVTDDKIRNGLIVSAIKRGAPFISNGDPSSIATKGTTIYPIHITYHEISTPNDDMTLDWWCFKNSNEWKLEMQNENPQ